MLEKGTYGALPSPSDQEVQTCILRMSKCADMTKAVAEAESPDLLVVTDTLSLLWQMRRKPWQKWQ